MCFFSVFHAQFRFHFHVISSFAHQFAALPDHEDRKLKAAPSEEVKKTLSKRLGGSPETVKEVERVIQSPDSETKISYDLQVDPATGKQTVTEKFTTTKKECAICNGYFAQILICADCGARMCANDSRRHTVWGYVDSWSNSVPYDYRDSKQRRVSKRNTICKGCATSFGMK